MTDQKRGERHPVTMAGQPKKPCIVGDGAPSMEAITFANLPAMKESTMPKLQINAQGYIPDPWVERKLGEATEKIRRELGIARSPFKSNLS